MQKGIIHSFQCSTITATICINNSTMFRETLNHMCLRGHDHLTVVFVDNYPFIELCNDRKKVKYHEMYLSKKTV